MPICKKCNTKFSNRVLIDGTYRVINKRKYCLICSPFNRHNTRQIHLNFSYRDRLDKVHQQQKKMRSYRKMVLVDIMGSKCEICGYNKCPDSFDFHHILPTDKKMNLAKGSICNSSIIKVIEELKKVVMLCANCHREVHYGIHSDLVLEWIKNLPSRKEYVLSKTKEDINLLFKFKFAKYFKKICLCCNKEFTTKEKDQKYCSTNCFNILNRKVTNRPLKKELEGLLENMTLIDIGRKYGVSDNSVRKWGENYGIVKI